MLISTRKAILALIRQKSATLCHRCPARLSPHRDPGRAREAGNGRKPPGFPMGAAGLMEMTGDMGDMTPHWLVYIGADDVNAATERLESLGGAVHRAPADIHGVGRFAVVADPHGAVFCLLTPVMPEGPRPEEPPMGAGGSFAWHELYAGNAEEALDFYGKLFGWTPDEVMDMGTMGSYRMYAHGGNQHGGMMTRMPDMPVPFWNAYIAVDALDAAAERLRAGGGQMVNGPMEVPGGGWALNAIDPQGAFFSLFSMVR